ncbi:hypothetical protein J2X20_002791 [Pelomonas saccharophila]|uniref:DUF2262 domain-containing protein n=1 Tax=Roseateles saccharophilus TaxID=304 RepID=A0ABU1YN34_ROSSA|nr:DUF2262 domain-containing protein [Roseateles saccharophilus]MDR7270133.1 hypothetical protein [Roseateles saccharophilus]
MNWIRRIRLGWKQALGRPAPRPSAPPLALSHPALGELAGTAEELRGAVMVGAQRVTLIVRPDGGPMDDALRLAVEAAGQLPGLHERSLRQIAEDSLASYNNDWRVGQTVGADGKAVDFEKPLLSAAEFSVQFSLTEVDVCGPDLLSLWYDCGDLFWGHSFSATFFDGLAGEIDVQMLG